MSNLTYQSTCDARNVVSQSTPTKTQNDGKKVLQPLKRRAPKPAPKKKSEYGSGGN